MYSYVCAATGWTWDYVGEFMTLPRLYAMFKQWRSYPPIAVTAALYVGIKPEGSGERPIAPGEVAHSANDDLGGWLASMPTLNDRKPGHG